MTIQANQGFGVSVFGATSSGGGGSTSPGGTTGQLQYNASGSFGGMAGTSWDDTNRALTLTGATVTTSQPVLNLSQTWNAAGVTFTGLKFNATDTASASGSLLLDLQVGGTSQFNLSKSGVATFAAGSKTAPSITFSGFAGGLYGRVAGFLTATSGTQEILQVSGNFGLSCIGAVSIGSTDLSTTGADLILRRAAAATLQLGAADAAAPVAQTLQVQSVVAGTSNTAGANFTIAGSKGTGTGAGGSIIFQVAPAGTAGTAQNAYATALTLNSAKDAYFNGRIFGQNSTSAYIGSDGSQLYFGDTGTNRTIFSVQSYLYVALGRDVGLGWTNNAASATGTIDLLLYRDAANTLALRNGTSAQKLRVYNTYTSGTSYENYEIDWQTTANIALVGPTKGSGGGTQRVQRLQYLEDGGTGSTTPSLGTTCPAASATIKSWIKVITSDGTTAYIPCWA